MPLWLICKCVLTSMEAECTNSAHNENTATKTKTVDKNSTTYKYKDTPSKWSSMSKRLTSKSWVFIRVNYLVASDLVVHQNWLFFIQTQWTPWDEHICFQQNTLAANVNAENKSPEWVWKNREIK